MCRLVEVEGEEDLLLVHDEPLNLLINACETICDFCCCGYHACDFSPEVIRNNFLANTNIQQQYPNPVVLLNMLLSQLNLLKRDFGSEGIVQSGYEHEECYGVYWTGRGVDTFVENVSNSIKSLLNTQGQHDNYIVQITYDFYSTDDS